MVPPDVNIMRAHLSLTSTLTFCLTEDDLFGFYFDFNLQSAMLLFPGREHSYEICHLEIY